MPSTTETSPRSVLLYDADCGFCQACVEWALERAQIPFLVAALESEEGRALLLAKKIPVDIDSIVVVDGDRVLTKSDAVVRVLAGCRFPWRLARFATMVPRRWRDALYDAVARHRHRLSSKGCPTGRTTPRRAAENPVRRD